MKGPARVITSVRLRQGFEARRWNVLLTAAALTTALLLVVSGAQASAATQTFSCSASGPIGLTTNQA
jgi:hypothetical protein